MSQKITRLSRTTLTTTTRITKPGNRYMESGQITNPRGCRGPKIEQSGPNRPGEPTAHRHRHRHPSPNLPALDRSKNTPPQQTNPINPPNNPEISSVRGWGSDRTTRPTTNQSRDGGTHHPSLHESKLRNTELIWGGQGGGHLGWRRARRTECEATGERRGRRRGKPER